MTKNTRCTVPTTAVRDALEALAQAKAERLRVWDEYINNGTGRPDGYEIYKPQFDQASEAIRAADVRLDAAYRAAGIKYSGSSCTTDYNMYTYREAERRARDIFIAA